MNCASPWSKLLGWPSNIIPKGSGEFERLSARIGKPKAIVAIARKLLVAVWHVLSQKSADTHGSRAGRCPHAAQLSRALWRNFRQMPLSSYALAPLFGSVGTREKVWKQFTTAVASIASKARTRKEGRPKSSSTALSLR